MNEKSIEKKEVSNKHDSNVATLASVLHEKWRKPRLDKDTGRYEPRRKSTTDEAWIASHGTDEVDIANTSYNDLPEDWQRENKASAEAAITEVERAKNSGVVNLNGMEFVEKASQVIHDRWLERNEASASAEQTVPYESLSEDEKSKDRTIVMAAVAIATRQN